MGFRELFSKGSGPKPIQEGDLRRVVQWCHWNKTHGELPKPILRPGQDLSETVCTPCYAQHRLEIEASKIPPGTI